MYANLHIYSSVSLLRSCALEFLFFCFSEYARPAALPVLACPNRRWLFRRGAVPPVMFIVLFTFYFSDFVFLLLLLFFTIAFVIIVTLLLLLFLFFARCCCCCCIRCRYVRGIRNACTLLFLCAHTHTHTHCM